MPNSTLCGGGEFQYRANANWARRPVGYDWTEVPAVAVDEADRVYLFNRSEHPVMVFDPEGNFLHSWGDGLFQRAHGITIGPDGGVYCTDDFDHTVRKFSPAGELLMTLGTRGQPSDTGATSVDFRTIQQAGPPFHYPTNVAFSPAGDIYVSDGYGNARIHKFTAQGELLVSWGEPGTGPGQFRVPHGIAVDAGGRVFVADRENSRLQIFSPEGIFQDEWTDMARPCQVTFDPAGNLYVAELGYRAGMWPGTSPPTPDATGGRVSIWSADRKLLARWGGGDNPTALGDFFAPHDICLDSHGNFYVAEVVWSAGGNRGLVGPDSHTLQKFVKI